jgi:hypothetical protein
MSIYYNKQIQGELWLRDLGNNINSANTVLSAIHSKYKNVNSTFYAELTSNQINRFDLFYDTIFLETNSGCIFEKFYIDSGHIVPYNYINLFNSRKNTTIDYWFNEAKNTIYYVEIFYVFKGTEDTNFEFNIILKQFDCTTGLASVLLVKQVLLQINSSRNWSNTNFKIENPKLTYNSDTKTFNVSFILRNSVKEFGMISLNILDRNIPDISEINTFLPYFDIDKDNSTVTDFDYNFYATNYAIILTESGETLLTESSLALRTE